MSQATKNTESYDFQHNATHYPISTNHYGPTNCIVGTDGLTSATDAATLHYDAHSGPYDYGSPMPHPWYAHPPHSYYSYNINMSTSSSSSHLRPYYNFAPYSHHEASRYQNQQAGEGMLYGHEKPSITLSGDVAQHKSAKRKRRKKSKDKPKRPLSAYNIFFMEERRRILTEASPENSSQKNSDADLNDEGKRTPNEKVSKKTKKTPHGKIGFERLAKVIGDRWRQLTLEELDTYKAKAKKDSERYEQEMKEYKSKCKAEESSRKDHSKTSEHS